MCTTRWGVVGTPAGQEGGGHLGLGLSDLEVENPHFCHCLEVLRREGWGKHVYAALVFLTDLLTANLWILLLGGGSDWEFHLQRHRLGMGIQIGPEDTTPASPPSSLADK